MTGPGGMCFEARSAGLDPDAELARRGEWGFEGRGAEAAESNVR